MIQYAYTLLYVPPLEHYIANEWIDVCFYRRSGDGIILTQDEETDSVERHDFYCILSEPQTVGETAIVAMKLRFVVNLVEIEKW